MDNLLRFVTIFAALQQKYTPKRILFSLYPGLKTGATNIKPRRGFLSWSFLPRVEAPGYQEDTQPGLVSYPLSTGSFVWVQLFFLFSAFFHFMSGDMSVLVLS